MDLPPATHPTRQSAAPHERRCTHVRPPPGPNPAPASTHSMEGILMHDEKVELFRALKVAEVRERTQHTSLNTLSCSD